MSISDIAHSLQKSALGKEIAQSSWLFPTIETIHVLAIVLVVGSILWVDLRLLNIANTNRRFTDVSSQLLPITWTSFAVAVIAGALLFVSKAVTYYGNVPFRLKMLCIVLAGVNMLLFNAFGKAKLAAWDATTPPFRARVAGGISVTLWIIVVALGRWIGFTT